MEALLDNSLRDSKLWKCHCLNFDPGRCHRRPNLVTQPGGSEWHEQREQRQQDPRLGSNANTTVHHRHRRRWCLPRYSKRRGQRQHHSRRFLPKDWSCEVVWQWPALSGRAYNPGVTLAVASAVAVAVAVAVAGAAGAQQGAAV